MLSIVKENKTKKMSSFTKRKLHTLAKRYCKNLGIKVVFSSFNIKKLMSVKGSSVIYKFNCAGCNAICVGETSRHLSTRVCEHPYSDKNSHTFKHLKSSDICRRSCSNNCFTVLDTASTYN